MRRQLLLPLALVLAMGLGGCAAEAGEVSSPATSPSTSAPSAVSSPAAPVAAPPAPVATVLISSTGVTTADATGGIQGVMDFVAGPDAMVEFLTEALGAAPAVTAPEDGDDECRGPATRYTWGSDLTVFSPVAENPPALVWSVQARTAVAGNGIVVRSSDGFAVGDDGTAIFDATPADEKTDEYGDSTGAMLFDVHTNADGSLSSGAALVTPEGTIGAIVAPGTTSEFYC